jgi:hypothetical protein
VRGFGEERAGFAEGGEAFGSFEFFAVAFFEAAPGVVAGFEVPALGVRARRAGERWR